MTQATATTRIRPKDRDAILQSLRAGGRAAARTAARPGRPSRRDPLADRRHRPDRRRRLGVPLRHRRVRLGQDVLPARWSARSRWRRSCVTVHADLAPDRRLHATGGQARSLYAELMRNIATRAQARRRRDDRAWSRRSSRTALTEARRERRRRPRRSSASGSPALTELAGGYDFAEVIAAYWRGHDTGNEQLKADAVRWLRGEFATRPTPAPHSACARSSTTPTSTTSSSCWPASSRLAGYSGLLVVPRRDGQPLQARQHPGPQRQLRADPAHPQRQPAGQRRAPRVPLRRHARVPARHPPRPLLLPGAAVAGSPRTRFAATGWSTTPGRSCDWPTSRRRTSTSCCATCATSRPAGSPTPTWCRTRRCTPSCSTAPSGSARPTSAPRAPRSRRSSTCSPSSSRTPAPTGGTCSGTSISREGRRSRTARPRPDSTTVGRHRRAGRSVQPTEDDELADFRF